MESSSPIIFLFGSYFGEFSSCFTNRPMMTSPINCSGFRTIKILNHLLFDNHPLIHLSYPSS